MLQQVWPTGLVWTEAEAYAAYGSRARFGPEDATFRSLSSRSLWAPDEELLLQEGSEASVWLPAFPAVDTTDVFEQLAQSRQRGMWCLYVWGLACGLLFGTE